jgi:hypothetical protein
LTESKRPIRFPAEQLSQGYGALNSDSSDLRLAIGIIMVLHELRRLIVVMAAAVE